MHVRELSLESMPTEVMYEILDTCNYQTLTRMMQTSRGLFDLISTSKETSIFQFPKLLGLIKDLRTLDHYLRESVAPKKEFIISKKNNPPHESSVKKISTTDLALSSLESLIEDGIDALADLSKDSLNVISKLQFGTAATIVYVVKRAQNRYKGDVFLLPNSCVVTGRKGLPRRDFDYGSPEPWQLCFETWVTNNKCMHWSDHYREDELPEFKIDTYLPVRLFYGKREGDAIRLCLEGRDIKLVCRQNAYRYQGKTFEQLATRLLSANRISEPSFPADAPSQAECLQMLTESREKYSACLSEVESANVP
jgi:hypothetical protein